MSADLLRSTAALMRERAEAATPGPWESLGDHLVWPSDKGPAANDPILAMVGDAHDDSAEHIASWHPAVALAVALLLDNEAALIDGAAEYPDLHLPINGARTDLLVAVARAYLGRDS